MEERRVKLQTFNLASLDLKAFQKLAEEVPFTTGRDFLSNLILASGGDPEVARDMLQKVNQMLSPSTSPIALGEKK